MSPFDQILHFFRQNSPTSLSLPNLKFLASTVCEIFGGGSKNSKSGSRYPGMTPFDTSLHYLSLDVTDVRLCTKFKVASFNRLRHITGVPKVGHVTPT